MIYLIESDETYVLVIVRRQFSKGEFISACDVIPGSVAEQGAKDIYALFFSELSFVGSGNINRNEKKKLVSKLVKLGAENEVEKVDAAMRSGNLVALKKLEYYPIGYYAASEIGVAALNALLEKMGV